MQPWCIKATRHARCQCSTLAILGDMSVVQMMEIIKEFILFITNKRDGDVGMIIYIEKLICRLVYILF